MNKIHLNIAHELRVAVKHLAFGAAVEVSKRYENVKKPEEGVI